MRMRGRDNADDDDEEEEVFSTQEEQARRQPWQRAVGCGQPPLRIQKK